jgi:ABC-2 type transport system ATP-binding protein
MTAPGAGSAWLAELTRALHRENVDRWHCDQVVAETRQHLADSGEDPMTAFGPAEAYARVVAAELAGAAEPPSVAPPRLVVEGVTKSYRRHRVLDEVHLVVAAGEVAAVVGPNGAGKSTLLRICAGLESPDAGRVTVHGRLGYCPQQPALVDLLRADEHFELVGAGRGLDREAARREGAELAARLDWVPDRRTVGELSGGAGPA